MTIRPMVSSTSEYLFINFLGEHHKALGREIPKFFRSTSAGQLHITSTSLRCLVETAAEYALRRGALTSEEREAISGINGHSSVCVKRFYLLMNRCEEVEKGQALFRMLMPTPSESSQSPSRSLIPSMASSPLTSPSSPQPESIALEPPCPAPVRLETDAELFPLPLPVVDRVPATWRLQHNPQPIEWGARHPCQAKNPKKVPWSDDEREYLANWIHTQTTLHPDLEQNTAVWRCLQHINSSPDVWAIFHPNHVLTTGRLRSGFDSLAPRSRRETEETN